MFRTEMSRRRFFGSLGVAGAAVMAFRGGAGARADARADRPNILWVYVEDMCPWMGCYGETLIRTPNLDALAGRGIRFERAFMPAGVCSATRSAIITGTMQTTFGLHNHRSARGRPGQDYDAIHLPESARTVPELFRAAGYYTFNEGKEDYNFVWHVEDLYDRKGGRMGFQGATGGSEWAACKRRQPFFGQIQLKGGKSRIEKAQVDPGNVSVPPYYPDHAVYRREIAHHYDCIVKTDGEVGEIVRRLREDGLLENTVLFFFTDHGLRLPRHKQFVYDGGIHVPLIIAGPGCGGRIASGAVRKDLVSGIDIAATSLALAGIEVPHWMEARDVLAPGYKPRQYIIAARDRCDFTIDRIRAVRTERYKYLRNFMTDRPWMQPQYRDGHDYVKVAKQLYAQGKLTPVQARFFGPDRPAQELYDLSEDPHETKNLVHDPASRNVLAEHRRILQQWILETDDKGQYLESKAGLRCVLKRWGDKCVNPEYDLVRGEA